MRSFVRTASWSVIVLLVAGLAALVVLLSTGLVKPFLGASPVTVREESRSTQVIDAVTREQQVVLLSLGIQGIEEKSANSAFFGMEIPGSERTSFMRYEFKAKLGFEGGGVGIKEEVPGEFLVSIPEFVFIGHEFVSEDGEPFKMVVESGGALSWVTPAIDDAEMINKILSEDARSQYIEMNREQLEDQAEDFYAGIVSAIDPDAEVVFEFD